MTPEQIGETIREMGKQARSAAHSLTKLSTEKKNAILLAMADAVLAREAEILSANKKDLEAADALGLTPAMKDRLRLDHDRIAAMARLENMASFPPRRIVALPVLKQSTAASAGTLGRL